MKLLIVTLCVLTYLIPAALSLKCYVCNKKNENCKTGETTCKSSQDRCGKSILNGVINKSCTTSQVCSKAKEFCKNQEKCEAYCCDSDLCNGGVPLKPVTFVTLLAMALAVAKYLI
ncbi:ly6/PLAUR domain-containing protein 1-like isoform X2 [Actinia tenebrosa]|uniref:Ly6/PLAUR domain-containing protein 1-like isoform X2 n=1 Tax=Actinia tenebrosa TaxID=6105 RepID=A0A6P8ICE5_ACTTE|nr:ly6/PLAUR domain-containing protein 1-like isoform X2 [Actinia tenebrosa]